MRLGERDAAAVDVVEPCVATAAMTGGYVGNALDDAYARARETLAQVVEQHHVRGVIAPGRASHELRAASRNADLLAIGLTLYGLLDRMLIGSTAHALLREQCAPTLITPPSARDEARRTHDALDEVASGSS